jgi:hypothetical protein
MNEEGWLSREDISAAMAAMESVPELAELTSSEMLMYVRKVLLACIAVKEEKMKRAKA